MRLKIVLITAIISIQVFAWGPIGHRTVGLIADANLSPSSKSAIAQLLNGQSLANVCNWADTIKSGTTYAATHWYHFENIPDNVSYIQNLTHMTPEQKALGGVVQAILVSRDILRNPNRSLADKSDALKFIAHFIGDIHQPMHTGRPDDKGGTTVPVTWFGTPMSLHQLWDSGMILTSHSDIIKPNHTLDEASLAYARYLVATYGAKLRFVSSDVEIWTNESLAIRLQAYNPTFSSNQSRYQTINSPQIDARILVAGMRLADTLNHIFASAPIELPEITFRRQIEAIVGNITQIINLKP